MPLTAVYIPAATARYWCYIPLYPEIKEREGMKLTVTHHMAVLNRISDMLSVLYAEPNCTIPPCFHALAFRVDGYGVCTKYLFLYLRAVRVRVPHTPLWRFILHHFTRRRVACSEGGEGGASCSSVVCTFWVDAHIFPYPRLRTTILLHHNFTQTKAKPPAVAACLSCCCS